MSIAVLSPLCSSTYINNLKEAINKLGKVRCSKGSPAHSRSVNQGARGLDGVLKTFTEEHSMEGYCQR